MDKTLRPSAEMTLAMALLGTIGWFVVESRLSAMAVVFWRCAFGAATLLTICAAFGVLRGHFSKRTFGLAVLGGLAMVANWVLLFGAFPRASISMATAVYNTQPFLLVAFGALFLGEKLTLAKVGWLLVAFAGLWCVVKARPADILDARYHVGLAMALAAAFFWALAAIIARRLSGIPPHLIALVHVAVGLLVLAPFQDDASLPATIRSWWLVIIMGTVHTGLLYILMYRAIQRLPTHLQASLSFVYPVVAFVVDGVAFHHTFALSQILGAAAIVVSAGCMTLGPLLPVRQERRRRTAQASDLPHRQPVRGFVSRAANSPNELKQ